jgi:hypothetical protein
MPKWKHFAWDAWDAMHWGALAHCKATNDHPVLGKVAEGLAKLPINWRNAALEPAIYVGTFSAYSLP